MLQHPCKALNGIPVCYGHLGPLHGIEYQEAGDGAAEISEDVFFGLPQNQQRLVNATTAPVADTTRAESTGKGHDDVQNYIPAS